MRPRWDIDERGQGVGHARRLPLVVECRLEGDWDDWRAGVAAFAILGRIAESGTVVEKREPHDVLELDVVTGVVSEEGPYATHGQTLRLRVTP